MFKNSLLKKIPHRRVIDKNIRADEIFDLYQLGVFAASDSLLAQFSGDPAEAVQEIVELVELQPQAEYRPHYHKKSAAIIYIVMGIGIFQLDQTQMPYHAGERILIPAGVLHGFITKTRTLFLSIQTPPILNPETNFVDLYYAEDSHEQN